MKKIRFLRLFLILAAARVGAQTSGAVFAPFISRLEAELRGSFLRLSWVDSPDARGPVYVYRSSFPFDPRPDPASLLSLGRPIEIPYGNRSYVDEIEGTEPVLYYFVAASDESGRSYDIPIAFTNTVGVRLPVSLLPESGPADLITPMELTVQGDKIIITFYDGDLRSKTLYRNIRPINQISDLNGAIVVQTKVTSPYTDYVVPGIPYYYAVIADEDLARGTVDIQQDRNTTGSPAEVPAGTGPAGVSQADSRNIRSIPLPLNTGMYAEVPSPVELSPEAARSLGSVPARPPDGITLKTPRLFALDTENPPAGGEEHALASIVKSSFSARNWEAAKEELTSYLAQPRLSENSARARFYLGQCYYFLYRPREGLFEFLAVQERYPAEAAEWIQSSLEMMRRM